MARRLVFIFFYCCSFKVFAAGNMTHLYFAERFCEINEIKEEQALQKFLAGSLFPDIRYISKLPREWTHFSVSGLPDVLQEADPFIAGMKFHAWIDEVREEFVESSGIYNYIDLFTEKRKDLFLKLIEEEILAEFYDGRQWSFCFDTILEEQRQFTASDEEILYWHSVVQYSMLCRVSWLLWASSYLKDALFGVSNEMLYEWSYLLPKLAKEPKCKRHMRGMMEKIITEIRQAKKSKIL